MQIISNADISDKVTKVEIHVYDICRLREIENLDLFLYSVSPQGSPKSNIISHLI